MLPLQPSQSYSKPAGQSRAFKGLRAGGDVAYAYGHWSGCVRPAGPPHRRPGSVLAAEPGPRDSGESGAPPGQARWGPTWCHAPTRSGGACGHAGASAQAGAGRGPWGTRCSTGASPVGADVVPCSYAKRRGMRTRGCVGTSWGRPGAVGNPMLHRGKRGHIATGSEPPPPPPGASRPRCCWCESAQSTAGTCWGQDIDLRHRRRARRAYPD